MANRLKNKVKNRLSEGTMEKGNYLMGRVLTGAEASVAANVRRDLGPGGARLHRLLKNAVSTGLCRQLKPAQVRNKGLFGTSKKSCPDTKRL